MTFLIPLAVILSEGAVSNWFFENPHCDNSTKNTCVPSLVSKCFLYRSSIKWKRFPNLRQPLLIQAKNTTSWQTKRHLYINHLYNLNLSQTDRQHSPFNQNRPSVCPQQPDRPTFGGRVSHLGWLTLPWAHRSASGGGVPRGEPLAHFLGSFFGAYQRMNEKNEFKSNYISVSKA